MNKLKLFLQNGAWKKLKKSDWIVVALVGILLLVIAIPVEKNSSDITKNKNTENVSNAYEASKAEATGGGTDGEAWEEAYVSGMEQKLKKVLSQVQGVGQVEVMITVANRGEHVVEKDSTSASTTTAETDSTGENRTVTEAEHDIKTVYVETKEETYPYVQKEKLPEIEGVVVVAEGAGNSVVVSDISDAVKALFSVEAHRIKVVKMCSKEE